tara:strand:- start:728 stop:1102 length:375 start_codon:yes stop_codon:yes gene_type:complete
MNKKEWHWMSGLKLNNTKKMKKIKNITLHESEKIFITGEVGICLELNKYGSNETYLKLAIHRNSTKGKQTLAVDLASPDLINEIKKGDFIKATVDIVTTQSGDNFYNNIYCHEIEKIIVKTKNK